MSLTEAGGHCENRFMFHSLKATPCLASAITVSPDDRKMVCELNVQYGFISQETVPILLASQLSTGYLLNAVLITRSVGHGEKLLVYSVSCEIC